MEFEKMKRKQLQALCKKHGIRANCTNLEMARLLAKVSRSENAVSEDKEKEDEEGIVVDIGNSNNEKKKKKKKVRFSPDVETREYEPSVFKGRGGRISRKRNVVDYGENRKIVNNNVDRNRRGLGKKRRVNDVYEGNSEGRVVEGCQDLAEIIDSSNELGKEGVKGFVASNVSRRKCIVLRKEIEKKTRKELGDSHLEGVCGGGGEIEKVCSEIGILQSMKRKELQSLCKKHGIPANKTNHEMARLLASILKENGSSSSTIDGSGTCAELKSKEEKSLEDNEVVRPCGNEDGAGNVGELKEVEKQVMREEIILPAEAKGFVPRKNNEKKRRKELIDLHLEEIDRGGEEIEKVCLGIESLQSMKRKELQSLCRNHGIPGNKTNLEMVRLLSAAILNVPRETGSSYSASDGFDTSAEIKLNEEEPDEGGCDQVVRPCGNEGGAGNVGELKEEEKQILREETMLPALTESISQTKQPIQHTKLMTPLVTRSLSNTKGYAGRANIKLSGDIPDGLSGFKENSVEEEQNTTPAVNDHSPESPPSKVICPPGLGKGMEVEEMSIRKESHDFNAHLTENNRSCQLDVIAHTSLDDIEAQVDVEPHANSEADHSDTNALGRTLIGEEICFVPATKDDDTDVGFVLKSDNKNMELVELRNEKELNNASTNGAYEEVLHFQNFGDCPNEISEEAKDVLDASNRDASETFIRKATPKDLTEALEDHKVATVLGSSCAIDIVIDEPFTVLPAAVMDFISSKYKDVDTHAEKLNVQEEDLGCESQIQIVDGNSLEEVSPNTHSRGELNFYQTVCDGVEVSRMKIVDMMVAPNAEVPTKSVEGEAVEVPNVKISDELTKDNDSGIKEVAPYLNENADERLSQNIHEWSGFSERWSVEQLQEKETEFSNAKVFYFMPGIHDNLIEGKPAENHQQFEDNCEISGEATDNGTHMESPKTLRMQQTPPNGSRSTESPCMLGLLFPDEREEFTEIQSAALETLSEDSKSRIETSKTINDSLEINCEKSGQLDNFMNSMEMVDPENIIFGNIKPTDTRENAENMDDGFTASSKLAEELTTFPQVLTSNINQALQSFTEELSVHNISCGNSVKKSIDTFLELKVIPVHDTAELENKTSDVASALVGGNEEYNDGEEPTTGAQQESTNGKDYMNVPVMPTTESMTNLEKLETKGLEKQLDNACFTRRDERILPGDEISNELFNVSASKQELTEKVREKDKNVEMKHTPSTAFGVRVDDVLNISPEVDHINSKGAADDLNDEHHGANQHSGNHNVENEGFFRSGNISTPSMLYSDDKNKGHAMVTFEATSLDKPNVAVLQNKETMDFECPNLVSSSKGERLEDSLAVSAANSSNYDKEVEKPDTEAQQLTLKNENVLDIRENSKMNIKTADELEYQQSESVYSVEAEVSELKMCRDVSDLLQIEEIERSIMQVNQARKIDELQGSCSPEIQEEESVEVKTKKRDISALVNVNEQFLSEDVPERDLSVVDQSISCINSAVGKDTSLLEITSALEDQHGENADLEGVELKICSNHDVSESLVEEIEHCDLPLKVDQTEGSCFPETHEDENVKVESYPANSENNEISGLVDATIETLLSEHVPKLFSSAMNQSTSPINAAVGQGTDGVQSQMKLPLAETTSLTVKQGLNRSAYVKQMKSPAFMSKHSRAVLIHGTPKRAFDSSKMKENIPSTKMQRAGNMTAPRGLTKRSPLKDIGKM